VRIGGFGPSGRGRLLLADKLGGSAGLDQVDLDSICRITIESKDNLRMRGCRHRTMRLPAPWCSQARAGPVDRQSHPTPERVSPGIFSTKPGRTHCFGGLPRSEEIHGWCRALGLLSRPWTTATRSSASGFCRTARGRPIGACALAWPGRSYSSSGRAPVSSGTSACMHRAVAHEGGRPETAQLGEAG
jgi:hypothetical protein